MYRIRPLQRYTKDLFKITKRNPRLQKRYQKVLWQMREDPFYSSLNTHKVVSNSWGYAFSSKVTGDLRIIWCFDENDGAIILLLATGGHSGGRKVYN